MSKQALDVDTLFCHEEGRDYRIAVERDGERVFGGKLEVKSTEAGPRPARMRVQRGSDEDLRSPDQFVDLARRADRIRISEQTSARGRRELAALFDAYQLDATVVRTCRYCADAGRYSPITDDTAIEADGEQICPDCAREELDREVAYSGSITSRAKNRLEDLLLEVQDLDRIKGLLSGTLDPDLTKVDEIAATTDQVDPVRVADLDLHPTLSEQLRERFETLLPVQSLAVEHDLLDGADQLIVSATATGKTLVGEIAGIDRVLRGEGTMLFLVPLVALANQTYRDFEKDYPNLNVSLRVGSSRIADAADGRFDPGADVIVGTYEGIDHALRTGRDLGSIGTVVIDEVHTLGELDRGHRLDGLIARLKYVTSDAQWIYLSATVGNPGELADHLDATAIEFEERPVPIERHVTFADAYEKVDVTNKLVKRAFDSKSSLGYRGQTIVFTNSRRRCHEISRRLEYSSAPYHAGLDNRQRERVENQFAEQELAAVVTTAALAAGVDFPASQVIFDSLAMGIEWLSVQEFHQMLGRAGRPDYHDRGRVYLLVEPDGVVHGGQDRTEDEVAFQILSGEMDAVTTPYDGPAAIEETLANLAVAGAGAKQLNESLLGEVPTKHAIGKLLDYGFIDGLEITPLGRVVTEHFLTPEEAFLMLDGARKGKSPDAIVADLELRDEDL
ncbi:MAG: DEAD/DEAH box helicase [Halococcoides sp.]